jgi:hypothetical protein
MQAGDQARKLGKTIDGILSRLMQSDVSLTLSRNDGAVFNGARDG